MHHSNPQSGLKTNQPCYLDLIIPWMKSSTVLCITTSKDVVLGWQAELSSSGIIKQNQHKGGENY